MFGPTVDAVISEYLDKWQLSAALIGIDSQAASMKLAWSIVSARIVPPLPVAIGDLWLEGGVCRDGCC